MKSIYDIENLGEIVHRIEQIKKDDIPLWGKMNSAQMFEHCARTLDLAIGKTGKKPRLLIGYILGPIFKSQYYNDKPWRKNSPTSPDFTVVDLPEFERSKQRLLNNVKEFSLGGPDKCTRNPSPFYGNLTPQQHGWGQYKHIDHHLQQFGV